MQLEADGTVYVAYFGKSDNFDYSQWTKATLVIAYGLEGRKVTYMMLICVLQNDEDISADCPGPAGTHHPHIC